MTTQKFILKEDMDGHLLSLSHPDDPYGMNWAEGSTAWGTVCIPEWPRAYEGWGEPKFRHPLKVTIQREVLENGFLQERYSFTNTTDFEVYIQKGEIQIYTPFNDSYESAAECKVHRCNAHIWCGDGASYVMSWRMGGAGPHLGLVLTEGRLAGYGIERDIKRGSNDRGDIILLSMPMRIRPKETKNIAWELFWFQEEREFFEILESKPNYIGIKGKRYVYFEQERIELFSTAKPSAIKVNESKKGIYRFDFYKESIHTFAEVIVLPKWEELLKKRVRFIVEKQQCLDKSSGLYGAYLIYDNEEKEQYYSHVYDHNGARERVGMGVLIARFLRTHRDTVFEQSLQLYLDYVQRELYDENNGIVFNDYGRNLEWNRLYNYAWMALFFYETYCLKKEKKYILYAANVLKSLFVSMNGTFYAIGLEMPDIFTALEKENFIEEKSELIDLFLDYAERIWRCGTDYPAHEVKYEQSIVQPAAEVMMQAYVLFKDSKYLKSAEEHLKLLELFNGHQPDYHLYETALRHWDGYWFGKRRQLGDTFPHHWSALTGQSFARYAQLTGKTRYGERAEEALRSPLSLFRDDGSASCAMIYPQSVNGQRGHFLDPWANDQDWALYYYLKWHDGLNNI